MFGLKGFLLAGFFIAAATAAMPAAAQTPDEFKGSLANWSAECALEAASASNDLRQMIDAAAAAHKPIEPGALVSKMDRNNERIDACKKKARANAFKAYRQFLADQQNANIKHDAKVLLAAWLTWLDTIVNDGNYESVEWKAYHQAFNAFTVDSL